jgi:hypothetical protein
LLLILNDAVSFEFKLEFKLFNLRIELTNVALMILLEQYLFLLEIVKLLEEHWILCNSLL